MKKQTKLWTMKDGRKIRICDMGDTHLINTIKMLNRFADHTEADALAAGYSFLATLQGEMAQYHLEGELATLQEDGVSPHEVCPLYENLFLEATRREIDLYDYCNV